MPSESHKLLLTSLHSYYRSHPSHKDKLKEIITGASHLSLRLLDWFVTHYSKKHHIVYFVDDTKCVYSTKHSDVSMRKFNVYLEYRAQLQSYNKLFFDSFRRHERITFVLDPQSMDTLETTVGQLNFFRWAFKNHVIDYIYDNITTIEEGMAEYQRGLKVTPSRKLVEGGKTVQQRPNATNTKNITGSIYVTFD